MTQYIIIRVKRGQENERSYYGPYDERDFATINMRKLASIDAAHTVVTKRDGVDTLIPVYRYMIAPINAGVLGL